MTNQPPPLDAEPTLEQQIQFVRNDIALSSPEYADLPVQRAILASLERLRATQRESGGESVSVPRGIVDMAATLFAEAGPKHIYRNGRLLSRDEASQISRMLFALSASQRKECGGIKDGDPLYPAENPLKEYEAYGQRKETP